jgi:S-adenosylmethionine synthetase
VQVAYAIGVAKPVGVHINTFGTGKVADSVLSKFIIGNFDMRPRAIVEELDLLRPIYRATSAYGHFGRSEFAWEKTDRAAEIADALLGSASSEAANGHAAANGTKEKNGRTPKAANGSAAKPSPRATPGRRGARAQA